MFFTVKHRTQEEEAVKVRGGPTLNDIGLVHRDDSGVTFRRSVEVS